MENPEGRTWRIQTLALLWKALDNRENEEQQIRLIQQAIANHNAYRQHFPEEAAMAVYLDRIEGVAHYVEVVAALRSSYQEIQSMPDRIDAYALLLQTKNVVDEAGIVAEAYALGVAAGMILYLYQDLGTDPEQDTRKEELLADAKKTPISILASRFPEIDSDVRLDTGLFHNVRDRPNVKPNYKMIFTLLYEIIF